MAGKDLEKFQKFGDFLMIFGNGMNDGQGRAVMNNRTVTFITFNHHHVRQAGPDTIRLLIQEKILHGGAVYNRRI